MAERKVKFELGLARYIASVLIFASHCISECVTRGGLDISKSIVLQYFNVYMGYPSLVLLCLMTGISSRLTPVPERTNPAKFAEYLTGTVGLWLRLTVIFNAFFRPTIDVATSLLGSSRAIPLRLNPLQILLGVGPFWYLSALMYWSIIRIWIRSTRQMRLFSVGLALVIMTFWLLPQSGQALDVVGRPLSRMLTGLWFIAIGYLLGPSFLGHLIRQSPGRLLAFLAIFALAVAAHESLLNHLFPNGRVIVDYMQPSAIALNPRATSMWDVPAATRLLAALGNLLRWGLILGASLFHFYITARLGSLLSGKTNALLAETSFTVYLLHFPLLSTIFGLLFFELSGWWTIGVLAVVYAAVLSLPFLAVTMWIRRSVWLRFLMWYKI